MLVAVGWSACAKPYVRNHPSVRLLKAQPLTCFWLTLLLFFSYLYDFGSQHRLRTERKTSQRKHTPSPAEHWQGTSWSPTIYRAHNWRWPLLSGFFVCPSRFPRGKNTPVPPRCEEMCFPMTTALPAFHSTLPTKMPYLFQAVFFYFILSYDKKL